MKYTAPSRIELAVESPTDSNKEVPATSDKNNQDTVGNSNVSEEQDSGTAVRSKEVTFNIGGEDMAENEERRSSSPFIPDESDMESEAGMENEDVPSRIPK